MTDDAKDTGAATETIAQAILRGPCGDESVAGLMRTLIPSKPTNDVPADGAACPADGAGCEVNLECPVWPPDLFAITGTVLRRSGAYVHLVDFADAPILGGLPDEEAAAPAWEFTDLRRLAPGSWLRVVRHLGRLWHAEALLIGGKVPADGFSDIFGSQYPATLNEMIAPTPVQALWKRLLACANVPLTHLTDLNETRELTCLLMKLTLIADEASAGFGIMRPSSGNTRRRPRHWTLELQRMNGRYAALDDETGRAGLAQVFGYLLQLREGPSSLNFQVSSTLTTVFPKQHTPQTGMTFRSLTHNLALCSQAGVELNWNLEANDPERETAGDPKPSQNRRLEDKLEILNILLLPWPTAVDRKCFKVASPPDWPAMPERYRFFSYERESQVDAFENYFKAACKKAEAFADDIDMVILPELALTKDEHQAASRLARKSSAILIGGVHGEVKRAGRMFSENKAIVEFDGLAASKKPSKINQPKHHRWCLDSNQIAQYKLAGFLPGANNLWENCVLPRRELTFVPLTYWLTFCVLICEDLARLDPVSENLRAVGPNLVISLLMDGPQIPGRWGSRYASVLADDPGSSVLTVTSLGMSRLSEPRDPEATNRSGVIALWRDNASGEHVIELKDEEDAAILNITCETREEFTADGRGDHGAAFTPKLMSWHPITTGVNA